ncbi:hypothetical protein Tco_0317724 [Tanacetum coccineum]
MDHRLRYDSNAPVSACLLQRLGNFLWLAILHCKRSKESGTPDTVSPTIPPRLTLLHACMWEILSQSAKVPVQIFLANFSFGKHSFLVHWEHVIKHQDELDFVGLSRSMGWSTAGVGTLPFALLKPMQHELARSSGGNLLSRSVICQAPDHPLTLTPEFGPEVTPGARLTRVVFLCVGPTSDPTTPVNRIDDDNPNYPPNLQDQILNHISSLKALIQLHNESPTGLVRPIQLSFDDVRGPEEKHDEEPEDLRKPYKEVLKSPFSRQIIEFSAPNHRTPTNLKIYDGSTDPDDHITRFVGAANQRE